MSSIPFRAVGLEPPVLQVADRLFGDMVEHGNGDLNRSCHLRNTLAKRLKVA